MTDTMFRFWHPCQDGGDARGLAATKADRPGVEGSAVSQGADRESWIIRPTKAIESICGEAVHGDQDQIGAQRALRPTTQESERESKDAHPSEFSSDSDNVVRITSRIRD